MISENDKSDKQFCNLGARPKRSSLKKNGKYNRQKISFHQQSLDDALEMKNVNSMESLKEYQWDVAKKIDRKLSIIEPIATAANNLEEKIDANNIDLNFVPSKLQATKIDGTKFSPKNDYVFDFDFADGTNSRLPKSRLMFKNSSSIPIDECSTNESDDSKSE